MPEVVTTLWSRKNMNGSSATKRVGRLRRIVVCFGILGLVAAATIVFQALWVGQECWRYTGLNRTIHYTAVRLWPTWILMLGATKEPA